jgi:polar amino acid transport system substrate-binding protein
MNRRAPPRRLTVIVASGLLTLSCGSLPRDPEGTLQRARGGRLRVGLVEHPPWVVRTEGEPGKELKGLSVAVREGDPVAYYLAEEDAVPVRASDLKGTGGPAAAPTWELERMGLVPSGGELHSEKHVTAVPPGENGFLKRLEEFLARERPWVRELLQKEAAR